MIRAALTGLGNIAFKYDLQSHGGMPLTQTGAIMRHPDLELVGGCAPVKEDRDQFEAWSNTPTFDSAEEMLAGKHPCHHRPTGSGGYRPQRQWRNRFIW